jgi:hypothetical protein
LALTFMPPNSDSSLSHLQQKPKRCIILQL